MEEKPIKEDPKGPKSPSSLEHEFKTLEQDWQSLIRSSSNARPPKRHRICNRNSTGSHLRRQLLLLDSSPKQLMSSLQHSAVRRRRRRIPPSSPPPFSPPFTVAASGELWKVRENELAKEQIRKERKSAIESGELKGRRLFDEEYEVGFDGDDEIQSIGSEIWGFRDCFETGEEKQGMLCFETGERKNEKRESDVVVKKVCFGIALMVFVVCIILSFVDGFGNGGTACMVPT